MAAAPLSLWEAAAAEEEAVPDAEESEFESESELPPAAAVEEAELVESEPELELVAVMDAMELEELLEASLTSLDPHGVSRQFCCASASVGFRSLHPSFHARHS